MLRIVYFSVTGQTRRFVRKVSSSALELNSQNPFVQMDEPFILVVPTYPADLTEPLNDFLETGRNMELCKGLFGGGNRNFGPAFCFTAYDLEQEYGIPVLHTFEFQGSEYDVDTLIKELETIEHPQLN